MSEEIEKSKTRMQNYDQASHMLRIKKKRRKRDLDLVRRKVLDTRNKSRQRHTEGMRVHCKIENSLKITTNNFTRARQNNDHQMNGSTRKDGEHQVKQKISCERLLPQPRIGIFRNGTSGKQIKKQHKTSLSQNKTEKRLPGDVIKLLDGEGHLFKKSEENELISCNKRAPFKASKNSSPRVTMVEAESEEKSIDDDEEVDLIKRMNTLGKECLKCCDRKCNNCKVRDSPSKAHTLRSTPTGNNETQHSSPLNKNSKAPTNGVIESVRRWRWSPVTCFEEFCAKTCVEHFVNCPTDGLLDPMDRSRMILRDLYSETNHQDSDWNVLLSKNPDKIVDQKSSKTEEFLFKFPSVSPVKIKQNNVNRKCNLNCDLIIPDWLTPQSKIGSIVEQNPVIEDNNANLTFKTNFNEIFRDRSRRKLKLPMPTKRDSFANQIPKNLMKNSRKIEEFKYPIKYERFDDLSHKPIPPRVDQFNNYQSNIRLMADSDINKSLEKGKYGEIETPSVVYHMLRHDKSFNKRPLNNTRAINKGKKKHGNRDKIENVNCGNFKMIKGILKNNGDKVSHKPNDRSFMYVGRSKSNDPKFFGDFSRDFFANKSHGNIPCTLQQEWKSKSEKSVEIPHFDFLKSLRNDAPYGPTDKSLELRSNYTKKWQDEPYDDRVNGGFFSFHDDHFEKLMKPIGTEKLRHSRLEQQPSKYFAVEHDHNLLDFPRRVPVYPHESQYNSDNFHSSAVRRPYYQSVDSRQIIEPLYGPTKNAYHSEFPPVDSVKKGVGIAQSNRDKRSELSHGTLWNHNHVEHLNNNKSNRHYHSQIDQINREDSFWRRDESYYFH